jgi:hypothetical protein
MRIARLLASYLAVTLLSVFSAACSSDTNTPSSGGGAGTSSGSAGTSSGGGGESTGSGGANGGSGGGSSATDAGADDAMKGSAGSGDNGVDGGGINGMCAACSKPNTLVSCPANPGNVNYCQEGATCCAGTELWSCFCLAETCTYHACGKL